MDAAGWDERYASKDVVWSAGPNRFVAEQVADLPPGRALDVAAGEGRHAVWLAQRGWQVTAVDFSRVGLDRARAWAQEHGITFETRVADVRTADLGEAAYDLVLIAYLQLPRSELAPIHRRAAAAVAPGGTLLVVGHDRDNLTRGHGGPQDPDRLLTVDELREDLAGTGLVIDVAEQVLRPVETDEGPREAIDTLVRAHRS